ncbi:hypothetical protein RFI_13950 [Reticulomyxa filosa]|uniref:Uncharacterized protein n=1 Tax=Reticulomyxa filosa TaxID=46433 RepID=X6ND26_RETFI|nr:hypothetical protein RFI_13950 [Reticulomyxa filosa]|eukprot:ETO23232.1 hypothetical protein RFI_13950 [Reticulomyxa filosa]
MQGNDNEWSEAHKMDIGNIFEVKHRRSELYSTKQQQNPSAMQRCECEHKCECGYELKLEDEYKQEREYEHGHGREHEREYENENEADEHKLVASHKIDNNNNNNALPSRLSQPCMLHSDPIENSDDHYQSVNAAHITLPRLHVCLFIRLFVLSH